MRLRACQGITLLELPNNRGFAAGNNAGLRWALDRGYDYMLLMNNDAYGESSFLRELLSTFASEVRCGLVCPKIRYCLSREEPTQRIWYAGGKFRQPRLIGEMIGMDQVDVGQYDIPRIVDFGVGCCMLIDRRVFEQIGLLDERFFFYQEDVDFSYRATLTGFQVWYQPAALVWHAVSRSTENNQAHRTFLYAQSRVVFFAKHIHGLKWVSVIGLEMIRLLRIVTRAIWQRRPEHAMAYIRGLLAGWQTVISN
jgi:hypothetical protein